eukprot:1100441-Prymnesium_polylepis.2
MVHNYCLHALQMGEDDNIHIPPPPRLSNSVHTSKMLRCLRSMKGSPRVRPMQVLSGCSAPTAARPAARLDHLRSINRS